MSAPTLSALPDNFPAGTTVKYNRALSDYSAADGWTLTLFLAGPSITDAIVGTANGATWDVLLSATATAKLKAGTYQWRELVAKGAERYLAASGTVTVTANIAAAGAGDMQTHEERTLAVIEAVLENRLTADVQTYQIAGRAVTKIPVKELVELRNQYRAAVRAQRNPGKFGTTIYAAFKAV